MDGRLGPGALLIGILFCALVSAFIFYVAGTLDYWQGWAYTAANLIVVLANFVIMRDKPELAKERLSPGKGMKAYDKAYFVLSGLMFVLVLLSSALESGRYGTSVPALVTVAAISIFFAGQSVFLWAKASNPFFSSVVRIQKERGQTVVSGGPYRRVRHPGYAGSILSIIATPIILGSLAGLLPAIGAALLLVIRTYLEDRTLLQELPGYKDYARKVRCRLIPSVW